MSAGSEDVREMVRAGYAAKARSGGARGCCGDDCGPGFGKALYDLDAAAQVPASALELSLGCGNPVAVAGLRTGETVLDLGSGGGIDVLLSARRVGPTGKAYGLDMTAEMLEIARANAARAGVGNAEFIEGYIEDIPLPEASVDVVISNCVVNLSADKLAVLSETHRVLRPGGRIGISDIVASDQLTAAERAERGGFVGCIAGALSVSEYEAGLSAAGFEDVAIELGHEVADRMYSAVVTAVKPGRART